MILAHRLSVWMKWASWWANNDDYCATQEHPWSCGPITINLVGQKCVCWHTPRLRFHTNSIWSRDHHTLTQEFACINHLIWLESLYQTNSHSKRRLVNYGAKVALKLDTSIIAQIMRTGRHLASWLLFSRNIQTSLSKTQNSKISTWLAYSPKKSPERV